MSSLLKIILAAIFSLIILFAVGTSAQWPKVIILKAAEFTLHVPQTFVGRVTNRFVTNAVQFQLAYQFEKRIEKYDLRDPNQMILAFRELRKWISNQNEIEHPVHHNSALLNGFGYCDQINSVAGILLSKFFNRIELVALWGRQHRGGHSILRVTAQNSDSFFVDVWSPTLVAFKVQDQAIQILASSDLYKSDQLTTLSQDLYLDAPTAFAFIRLKHNIWSYFFDRAIHSSDAPPPRQDLDLPKIPKKMAEGTFQHITYRGPMDSNEFRNYLKFRIDCLWGEPVTEAKVDIDLQALTTKWQNECVWSH